MKGQLHGLTATRGIACMWVLILHGYYSLEGMALPESEFMRNCITRAWLTLDLFFILSGFIMCHSNQNKVRLDDFQSLKDFWIKRFARIYPVHITVVLLWVGVVSFVTAAGIFTDTNGSYTASKLVAQIFLVHGLGFGDGFGWNTPSWSVSSEALAYLLFPALAYGLLRIRGRLAPVALITLVLAASVWLGWSVTGGERFMAGFKFSWWRVLSEFVLGMALHRIYLTLRPGKWAASLVALSLVLIFAHGNVQSSAWDFGYLAYFLLLILGLALYPFSRPIPFGNYLGEISYSIYLIHSMVIMAVNQLVRATPFLLRNPDYGLFLTAGISVAAAGLLYKYIEVPGRRALIARLVPKRKPELRLVETKSG